MNQVKNTPGDEFYLTYDDYYGNQEEVQAVQRQSMTSTIYDSGKISFEEFVKKNASQNIFDNEVSFSHLSNVLLCEVIGAAVQVLGNNSRQRTKT